jgi:hypothetical protein
MNADEKSQLWRGTSMLLGLLVFVLVAVIPIANCGAKCRVAMRFRNSEVARL